MTWITFPLIIGGLVAAVVPVVIHLVMRGVPKRIEFPSLMLLKPTMVAHAKKYRLKHWWLLAIRVLLIVLLGVALARPSVKLADWFPSLITSSGRDAHGSIVSTLASSLTSQDAPVTAILVIDTSPRMGCLAANKTSLDHAKEFAAWIIGNLPPQSRVALLTGDSRTDTFQLDLLAASQQLNRVAINPSSRRVADSVRAGLDLLRRDLQATNSTTGGATAPEIYVISDMTLPGWDDTNNSFLGTLREEVAREAAVFLIDIGMVAPNNTGIVNVTVSSPQLTAGATANIQVEIIHCGEAGNATVEMMVQDGSLQDGDNTAERRGSRVVAFEAGESRQQTTLSLAGLTDGWHHITLKLTTPDSLAIDDARYLTLEVAPPRELLVVAPTPLRQRAAYLREAVALAQTALTTREMTFADFIAATPRDWSNSHGIILLDPPPLTAERWRDLAKYVSQGNGLGVALGRDASPVDSFQVDDAVKLLGCRPVRQARAADPDSPLWLIPEDADSPLLAPFRRLRLEQVPWDALSVFRYWETSDAEVPATVEFRFSDRRPAIVSQRHARGVVMTMMTPLSDPPMGDAWNFIPQGDGAWVFVVLAEGIARFLTGSAEKDLVFSCEDRIPMQPGHYTQRETGATLESGFSVNVAPAQVATLARIEPSQLDAMWGAGRYHLARTPAEVEAGISRRRVGQELYTMGILLVAVLFATEWIVANRFYRQP